VLTASAGGRPDRVPVCLSFFQIDPRAPRPREWTWHNQVEQAEAMLRLGADALLHVVAPYSPPPDVEQRVWRERREDEPRPIIVKEYRTPRGTLQAAVRETEDWQHGLDIPLFSDLAVSRATKWWVNGEQDLDALSYLLRPPTSEQRAAFREQCQAVRREAHRLGVAVEGVGPLGGVMAGDAAAWLMGFENLMLAMVERPQLVTDLLGVIHRWQMALVELLAESEVDIIKHRAWYESADHWSPALYRQMLAPLVREEVVLTHQAGKLFSYIMTTGVMPLLPQIAGSGIDILWGVDPVQGRADLRRIKTEVGARVSLWGGVNGAVTVGRGTREEIRAAVEEACRVLGAGGGYVLTPVDSIFEDCPWENVLALVEAAREFGRYS
jgi:hypothetical protein